MSTRSVIAVPVDGAVFKGRYAHWDGYPSHMGVSLVALVARDGYEAAVRVLTEEHYSWSTIDPDQGEEKGEYQTGVVVPGYGTAHTDATADDWVTAEGDDWGTEYAYLLLPTGVRVYERRWNDGAHMTGMFGMGADAGQGYWAEVDWLSYEDDAATILERLQS